MANKDIVEFKNSTGVIVYPKTTGEAVYLKNEEDLQAFLDALHDALVYNIYPKENEAVSLGKDAKKFKDIYTNKIVVAVISAPGGSMNIGTVTATSVSASTVSATTISGNVNSAGEADKGEAGKKVYGAVAN